MRSKQVIAQQRAIQEMGYPMETKVNGEHSMVATIRD
jgi:hypothetical protein